MSANIEVRRGPHGKTTNSNVKIVLNVKKDCLVAKENSIKSISTPLSAC